MNRVIDIGNTRLKLATLADDGRIGDVVALAHGDADRADWLAHAVGPAEDGDTVWLASVASLSKTETLTGRLSALGYRVERVRTRAQFGRLRIAYAEPARLGVDRFLAMVAASVRDDGPWLLVSVGSALTIDALAADGTHLGGLIAPTPSHVRDAMAERFPVMDLPAGRALDFAADTADAVASGARAAALGAVERSLRLAEARLGAMPTVLVSGGGAEVLDALATGARVDCPALVLEGLALVARSPEN
jgi:type III pantothenate kinase